MAVGYILHFGAITLTVNGTGILRMSFLGIDDLVVDTLFPLQMSNTPGREPRVLANTKSQSVRLKLQTIDIDEVMRINRIIIWTKDMYKDFPG